MKVGGLQKTRHRLLARKDDEYHDREGERHDALANNYHKGIYRRIPLRCKRHQPIYSGERNHEEKEQKCSSRKILDLTAPFEARLVIEPFCVIIDNKGDYCPVRKVDYGADNPERGIEIIGLCSDCLVGFDYIWVSPRVNAVHSENYRNEEDGRKGNEPRAGFENSSRHYAPRSASKI